MDVGPPAYNVEALAIEGPTGLRNGDAAVKQNAKALHKTPRPLGEVGEGACLLRAGTRARRWRGSELQLVHSQRT